MSFLNKEKRSSLHFKIYLPDVFTDKTHKQYIQPADKKNRDYCRGPSRNRPAGEFFVKGPDHQNDGHNRDHKACKGGEPQRDIAERRDPLPGKGEHFSQRIFGLPGVPFMSIVINNCMVESEIGKDPPKEDVSFPDAPERLDYLAGE